MSNIKKAVKNIINLYKECSCMGDIYTSTTRMLKLWKYMKELSEVEEEEYKEIIKIYEYGYMAGIKDRSV